MHSCQWQKVTGILSKHPSYGMKYCWRNTSLFLVVVILLLLHQTNAKVISTNVNSHLQSSGNKFVSEELDEKLHQQRTKRTVESESKTDLHNGAFMQNVAIAVSIVAVFCISVVSLVMCIFCNACEDDKASEGGGANGYVGEINLADIQVIYNPSAGAAQLPYTHQNQAFRSSQEDIVFRNPAVLQVTSRENITAQTSDVRQKTFSNQNPRLIPGEGKQLKESHQNRNRDVYADVGYPYNRHNYENPYAQNMPPSQNKSIGKTLNVSSGKENIAQPYTVKGNSVHDTHRSSEFINVNNISKEYDMNDLTIKNMHIRY